MRTTPDEKADGQPICLSDTPLCESDSFYAQWGSGPALGLIALLMLGTTCESCYRKSLA